MASLARSAAAVARSALRPASLTGRVLSAPLPPLASSSPARAARILRRSAAAASAGLETLMPLHTAVAGARLRSCIAVDSSCWSSLSQGNHGSSSINLADIAALIELGQPKLFNL
ncbi:hypothetical protein PR202_ga30208 [Eleusine coracana subsp. coracana]|uniref:Uncharacterized protein n=1 Tax=Eleusine coracana subsp. coracana TaxID=191504 RepID=A0AAV5DLX0_ELECO|nr:hypothetical protein PR202_ga30208 [Eleusine coracana subsp. coracana]